MRVWTIFPALVFVTLGGPLSLAEDAHTSFLQAGIFFMTGREPPNDVQFLRPDLATVYNELRPLGELAKHEYKVYEDRPCTIYAWLLEPPYGSERLEFQKLPSPRAMRTSFESFGHMTVQMIFPTETWYKFQAELEEKGKLRRIPGTGICITDYAITGNANIMSRRLAALDYIRANFCPGQPEPTPPPRKPY